MGARRVSDLKLPGPKAAATSLHQQLARSATTAWATGRPACGRRTVTTAGPSVPATPKPRGIDDAEGAARGRAAASAPQSIGRIV